MTEQAVWWIPEIGWFWKAGPDPYQNVLVIAAFPRAVNITNPEAIDDSCCVTGDVRPKDGVIVGEIS